MNITANRATFFQSNRSRSEPVCLYRSSWSTATCATLMPAAEQAGVKITDGRGFYLNPDDGKRFLRVPFCGLTPEELEEAFALLLPLIKK